MNSASEIIMESKKCFLCEKYVQTSSSPLTLKVVEGTVQCSKARDDNKWQSLENISEPVTIFVYEKCHLDHTRSRIIEKQKRKAEVSGDSTAVAGPSTTKKKP